MQLFVQTLTKDHLTSEEMKAVEIEISVRQNKLSEMDSIFTKHRRVPDIKHKRLCHKTVRVIAQIGHKFERRYTNSNEAMYYAYVFSRQICATGFAVQNGQCKILRTSRKRRLTQNQADGVHIGWKATTVGPNLRMGVKVGLFSPLNSHLPWVPDNIFIVPGVCFSIGINEERKGVSHFLHVLFEFLGFPSSRGQASDVTCLLLLKFLLGPEVSA